MRTLLIDNYDSYTFNLFHLLGEVNDNEPVVVRNDELTWDELAALGADNVVISPGPGRPEHARDVGVALDALHRAEVPVLGVCLGHQALAHVSGGTVVHAPEVMHGRLSPIQHDESALFAGLPQDFLAVRYHSLVVGAVPADLRVSAWTPDGVVMGLEHKERPLFGVQFHPESVSTRHGRRLIENFRDLTRARGAPAASRFARPRRTASGYAEGLGQAGVRVHHRRLETWSLGFFAVNGTADLNVVIRTLVASSDGLRVGAGGAIVVASDPEAELEEMLLKAGSVLATVGGQPPASKTRISPRRSSRPSPLQRA